jgi:hypothetical protein
VVAAAAAGVKAHIPGEHVVVATSVVHALPHATTDRANEIPWFDKLSYAVPLTAGDFATKELVIARDRRESRNPACRDREIRRFASLRSE